MSFGNAIVLATKSGKSITGKRIWYEELPLPVGADYVYDRVNGIECINALNNGTIQTLVDNRASAAEPFTNIWCVVRTYKNSISINDKVANGAKYLVGRFPLWLNVSDDTWSDSGVLSNFLGVTQSNNQINIVYQGQLIPQSGNGDYVRILNISDKVDLDVGASPNPANINNLVLCDVCYDLKRIVNDFGATHMRLSWVYYKGTTNLANKTQVFENAPVDYPEIYFVYEGN